jgi:NAD(P)H-dependent FMN reductase
MLKIALIVGSTRPNRFADKPVAWIQEGAAARTDFQLDTLDLRDHPLDFYEEAMLPPYNGGAYVNARAEAWRTKIGEYDGFIVTAAEYNHAPTAALKNAFDSATFEWNRKPVAFVGYGSTGGSRAIEHLVGIAVELQMAPVKAQVNINREPMLGVMMNGKALNDYDYLAPTRETMFDQIVWWGNALKTAREAELVGAHST